MKVYLLTTFMICVQLCFYIQDSSQTDVNEHEYIDLGLSVNWATYNIGSNKPSEYGDYFAWGETYTKASYNRMTYKFTGESLENKQDFTKYLGRKNWLNPNDVHLDSNDDAALQTWGKGWRIPTKEEIEELLEKCKWVNGENDGINGYWAISKINGNKIFFPFAGWLSESRLCAANCLGIYQTSEIKKDHCDKLYILLIDRNPPKVHIYDFGNREEGYTIRAVRDKDSK